MSLLTDDTPPLETHLATAQIFQQMIKQAQKQGVLSLKDLLRKAYQPVSSNPPETSPM